MSRQAEAACLRRASALASSCVLFVDRAASTATGAATRRSARTASRPSQQQDVGIGQVEYLCHNGQIVTK